MDQTLGISGAANKNKDGGTVMTAPAGAQAGRCPITFSDRETLRSPFAAYAQLHREAPVHQDPVTGFFLVTKYEDVKAVCSQPEIFSSNTGVIFDRTKSPVAKEVQHILETEGYLPMNTLVTGDPPEYHFYLALVDTAFRGNQVKSLEP